MSTETVKVIVAAALEAAKAIAKITPNTWDDKVAEIAELIVAQVFQLIGSESALPEEVQTACAEAADKIRPVVE